MFGRNNGNPGLPIFPDENQFLYRTNASNQLQLFGNVPAGCNIDPVNYFGNEHPTPTLQPNKRGGETEDVQRQQKLHISLNYNMRHDDTTSIPNRSTSIPNCSASIPNRVSTGLKLAYDDDERNSSVTSASGSRNATPNLLLSLGQNISTELDLQNEEFDQCIKIQEENMVKGMREMTERHFHSFLAALEKGVSKKIMEKDMELENMNHKNTLLLEKIKQVAAEAQNWHYRAKYNESLINVLKSNLQHAISQGADNGKEGFGECEVDDAASYINPQNNYVGSSNEHARKSVSSLNLVENKEHGVCKVCKAKEVSILLMPCRHLCVCKDCNYSVLACPICHMPKTVGVEIYLS